MKVKVTLYSGGRTFDEIVIVDRYEDANLVASNRNPTSKIIAKNVIFEFWSNFVFFGPGEVGIV